jgi:DNA-binding transcriptional MerR regulator
MVERGNLVKIGRLAKKADILPSKIRFYVQEELLKVVDRTNGGYYLFDEQSALKRLKLIEKMQKVRRLRLHEIREELNSRHNNNVKTSIDQSSEE